MDVATASAVSALSIAIIALFIATAQVIQQYLVTGQLIRLCDSVVFGSLPGQGKRVWELAQFRFRVVYEIPRIGIRPDIWPSSAAPSFADIKQPLPNPDQKVNTSKSFVKFIIPRKLGWWEKTYLPSFSKVYEIESNQLPATHMKPQVGEASWASFARLVYPSCHASIGFNIVTEDADRCPTDLPTVAMQASLRDVAIMSLMIGLECIGASSEFGSISMQGNLGTITSSKHPVLGPTVHFTPRQLNSQPRICDDGTISVLWLWRVMGNGIVAGKQYNSRGRRSVEKEIGEFLSKESHHIASTKSLVRHNEVTVEPQPEVAKTVILEHGAITSPFKSPQTCMFLPMPQDGEWSLVSVSQPGDYQKPYVSSQNPEPCQPDFSSMISKDTI